MDIYFPQQCELSMEKYNNFNLFAYNWWDQIII